MWSFAEKNNRGEGEEKGLGLSAVDAGPRQLIAGKSDPPGNVCCRSRWQLENGQRIDVGEFIFDCVKGGIA